MVVWLTAQLADDGSGAFPLPSQPGVPLVQPPAQLLRQQQAAQPVHHTAQHGGAQASQQPCSRPPPNTVDDQPASGQCGGTNVSSSSPPRSTLVQHYLVEDPTAEGVPPAAFAGVINRAEQARQAASIPTAGVQNGRCHSPGSIGAAGFDAGACCDAAQSSGCKTGHDSGNGVPSAGSAAMSAAVHAALHMQTHSEQHNAELKHGSDEPTFSIPPQQQLPEPEQRDMDPWAPYRFPDAELAARGIVLDIVSPQSTVVNCFTKSYGSYSKVTPAACEVSVMDLAWPRAPACHCWCEWPAFMPVRWWTAGLRLSAGDSEPAPAAEAGSGVPTVSCRRRQHCSGAAGEDSTARGWDGSSWLSTGWGCSAAWRAHERVRASCCGDRGCSRTGPQGKLCCHEMPAIWTWPSL
jgi:hypothetical protein